MTITLHHARDAAVLTIDRPAGLRAQADLFVQTARTAGASEGIAAFVVKRPSRFLGR
ncbi:hypothetical protein Tamer19_63930 [Cupriavidus sp. TA19]|uniref:hypothetical protein n=1 Tax=unclassified Cupriavidus TaxID=2640874 RepID=UPI000EE3BDA8|nr:MULTISPECIES: hypothetical protein [unclassified Cupriavidus]BDB27204.1 hypothetical protein CTP10_R46090 [Cupriavidus sp. P-10]GLC96984.1 hypothetical protein Tamer19_63930 [Cupriavidus sp. TA19]